MGSGHVDTVMHLANPASPADFERIPIQILKVGGLGTHNCSPGQGEAAFFPASTSEVYGDPLVHPQPGRTGATSTRRPRGVCDEPSATPGDDHGLTLQPRRPIVRIFTTYGPSMRPTTGGQCPTLQALRGDP